MIGYLSISSGNSSSFCFLPFETGYLDAQRFVIVLKVLFGVCFIFIIIFVPLFFSCCFFPDILSHIVFLYQLSFNIYLVGKLFLVPVFQIFSVTCKQHIVGFK